MPLNVQTRTRTEEVKEFRVVVTSELTILGRVTREDGAVVESTDYRYYTQGVFEDIPAYPVYSSRTLSQAQIYQAYVRCLGEVGEALDISTTSQAF